MNRRSALRLSLREEIFAIVAELAKAGVTVLLVEQNANAALKLANRAYVLETGRIVLAGDDLRSNKKVREAYFGELSSDPEQPQSDQTRSSQ